MSTPVVDGNVGNIFSFSAHFFIILKYKLLQRYERNNHYAQFAWGRLGEGVPCLPFYCNFIPYTFREEEKEKETARKKHAVIPLLEVIL